MYQRSKIETGILIGSLFFASAAIGHGNEQHILGTVKEANDKSILVETPQKKELEVQVDEKTKFERAGKPAELKDVKSGERVAIHAAAKNGKLTATTVKIGTAGIKKPEGRRN